MRRPTALLLLMVAGFSPAAWAQQTFELQPNLITLRPAAEPIPALRYRLVRERITLVPGNAAISYYRANIFLTKIRSALTAREKMEPVAKLDRFDEQTLQNWNSGPIADIPTEKARKHLERCKDVLNEVELGALRSTCDWELDERREGISLLLPEMQEMRSLGRLVTLRARLAILDRKTDEAIHWIETGLVMGRHISQGPVVIQALVGISVDSMMVRCLEDLIQSADCPNLYWALADRPRPFIDIRHAMEGERYRLETMLPEVRELDSGPWSIEKAQRFVDELERKLDPLAPGFLTPNENVPKELRELGNGIGVAAIAAKIFPLAKRALIARGRTEAQVDAMPITQAAVLYTYQEYQRKRDDFDKWLNVPYGQSYHRIDRAGLSTTEEKSANPLLAMIQLLTESRGSARVAAVGLDRRLDALQCIEAIRLYAAANEGGLPTHLEAITDSPAPLDPFTGKPFLYDLKGDSATLSAPMPPGFNYRPYIIRYKLKLAK
jgi:hypothetical protein